MVAVNDVVVPVSLTRLEIPRETKCSLPGTGFGRALVFAEGELFSVAVPGTEEVNGLDTDAGAHFEGELDRVHFDAGDGDMLWCSRKIDDSVDSWKSSKKS